MTVAPDAAPAPVPAPAAEASPAQGTAPIPDAWVRLPLGSALAGAIVVSLVRPVSWVLGLAGFLAGGGLILVSAPVLVLPTPTGLQTVLGGPITQLVFGVPTLTLVLLVSGAIAGAVAILVVAVLTGAWCERQGIGVALEAAAEEGLAPAAELDGAPGTGSVAAVRLLGLVPVGIAAALAWRPVYDAAYRQLILPDDLVTPLPIRVIADVPLVLLALGITWLLADSAAAVGVRRLVLERRPVLRSWALGWADLVRRPQRVLPTALAGLALLVLLGGPALAAAAIGWVRVRDILAAGRDPVVVLLAVTVWVTIWLGGLALAGVASAIRAAAWTLEVPRRMPPAGTSPR